MATSIYLPDEIKRKLAEKAQEFGFDVKPGASSQLPQFVDFMIDNLEASFEVDEEDSVADVWENFFYSIRPAITLVENSIVERGMRIQKTISLSEGVLYLDVLHPITDEAAGSTHDGTTQGASLMLHSSESYAALGEFVLSLHEMFNEDKSLRYYALDLSEKEAQYFLQAITYAIQRLEQGCSFSMITSNVLKDDRTLYRGVQRVTVQDISEDLIDSVMIDDGLGETDEAINERADMANFSLKLCPTNIDAMVVLASATQSRGDLQRAIEMYQAGITAWEKEHDKSVFSKSNIRGRYFWGSLESRPYMRCLLGLLLAYREVGNYKEALVVGLRMLKLNPGDNQGIRDWVMPFCIITDNKKIESIIERWQKIHLEITTAYSKALWSFKENGATSTSVRFLKEAFAVNPYLPEMLLDFHKRNETPPNPTSYSHGSVEEALNYLYCDGLTSWQIVDGAIEWLKKTSNRSSIIPKAKAGDDNDIRWKYAKDSAHFVSN